MSRFDRDEPVFGASAETGLSQQQAAASGTVITAPSLQLPSILPPQVAEQIRSAQQRAALQNQAPAAWAIGARCQAVYSGDGEWYSASVSGVTAADTFLITFAEYGNQEEVHRSNVRPRPDSSEVYRGVSAPKRKAVAEAPQLEEMPKVTSPSASSTPSATSVSGARHACHIACLPARTSMATSQLRSYGV